MPLRIGFDMDGVLADFARAYHDVEVRLFGPSATTRAGDPENEAVEAPSADIDAADPADPPVEDKSPRLAKKEARELRRRHDVVWHAIRATPDFWTTVQPTEPDAVRRIHEMMLRHRWEVFFITQRPATAGETVQRQTQKWLVQQGFDLPSVIVINGSRGAAAGAMKLDFHVDDSPTNCVDVKSESTARPILIVPTRCAAYRCGTSRISILHPTASAYFFREVSDGACLPADSRRETVLLVVRIRVATAACVRPARARAASISFATAYSTARA